jgi:hypothetical protein
MEQSEASPIKGMPRAHGVVQTWELITPSNWENKHMEVLEGGFQQSTGTGQVN